ncbi:hypothetical protein DLM45_15250 [Hyphomicrobium methylovorum]|uniref:helix-turn-helix domain-containing protein n=1 Tax=Hyphomicrobium methylovorum TaxID=84 RepID=UPI0015E6E155|nr:helix-turn-helix domain-containing protein [Hyphomicrobium methylovorum]MBA2127567.1 hypothetical protein [Hyphomicrobium methylovorum]
MSKPLPEHVTRAEAAKVLRLSLRQVDRLAKSGDLKKTKLGARRSGFERNDFERYLAATGNGSTGYVSPLASLIIGIEFDTPAELNRAAELLDGILSERFPGCILRVDSQDIVIAWNAALGYTAERISGALRT